MNKHKQEHHHKQHHHHQHQHKIEEQIDKELPCFIASGILAKYAANAVADGKVLKFTEPMDAKIPTQSWKLFPFKDDTNYNSIALSGKSAYLIGRDMIADILVDSQSVSQQHAVIQFRQVYKPDPSGQVVSYIKPYLMDLESTNGTIMNGDKIESARYYELLDNDVLQFGNSKMEYVLIRG